MPSQNPRWILALALAACAERPLTTPESAVADLLRADRSFSAASAQTDLVSGLTAMFAADVVMPIPGGRFATGVGEVADALRQSPDSSGARIEWSPIGGGISSDGRHGFTFGYMTLRRTDSTIGLKYLSYWLKGTEGWRVAVYRRTRRAEGAVSPDSMAPVLPERLGPEIADTAIIAGFAKSLHQVERSGCHPERSECHPERSGCPPEPSGCHPERSEGSLSRRRDPSLALGMTASFTPDDSYCRPAAARRRA